MKDFSIPVRVYYEDTDSGGVVYHANYLKFMERARTDWFRELGFELDQLSRDYGVIFVVCSVDVKYLRPARFNDLLDVTAMVTERGPMSCIFRHTIRRSASDSETLVEGLVRIACLNIATFRPQLMPEKVMQEMGNVG